MSTLLRCIVENSEPIARAACVDSGKTTVDAMVGEILVTCEKLRWTISSGALGGLTEQSSQDVGGQVKMRSSLSTAGPAS